MLNIDATELSKIINAIMQNAQMAAVIILALAALCGIFFIFQFLKKMPNNSPEAMSKLLAEQAADSARRLTDQAREHSEQLRAQSDRHAAQLQSMEERHAGFYENQTDRIVDVTRQNSIAFTRMAETIDGFKDFLQDSLPTHIERAVEKGFAKGAQTGASGASHSRR